MDIWMMKVIGTVKSRRQYQTWTYGQVVMAGSKGEISDTDDNWNWCCCRCWIPVGDDGQNSDMITTLWIKKVAQWIWSLVVLRMTIS